MTTEAADKKPTPPYLGVAWLDKTVNILSSKTPDEVSTVLFMANGFSKVDALLAIGTLKFLGLVDDNGKSTDLMPSLRLKGDKKREAFKPLVEKAYAPLFSTVDAPQNLSNVDLTNAFHAHYPKLSDRVIRSAIPVFLKLCEYAGLKEEGSVKGWTLKPRAEKSKSSSGARAPKIKHTPPQQETSAFAEGGFAPVPVAEGRMILLIPAPLKDKILDDESLGEDWSALRGELRQFADKHIPKTSFHSASKAEDIEEV